LKVLIGEERIIQDRRRERSEKRSAVRNVVINEWDMTRDRMKLSDQQAKIG
jgi:hypothetical protein